MRIGETGTLKLWLVELGSEEEKMEVIKLKGRVKGSVIRIDEGRTWRKRKIIHAAVKSENVE